MMMPVDEASNVARTQGSIAVIPRVVMNIVLRDDCLNLCHLNAQSLCARQLSKFEEFKNCFTESKVDIVCVTETWLNDNVNDTSIQVDGYTILRHDRKTGRGGGICVYHKMDIDCRIISGSNLLAGQPDGDRTEYLFIEVRANGEKFLLGVIYSPPEEDCSNILEQRLAEMSLGYKNIVLIGDFNTNLNKICSKTTRFRETLINLGLFPVNNEPTHFYPGGSSLIDLLITNDTNFVLNFNQVSASGFSHHDMIFSSLNIPRLNKDCSRMYRDYNRIDFYALHGTLGDMDWSLLYSITDSNIALDIFNSSITRIYESFVPLRAQSRKSNAPWFNNEILNAMINRDVAYRQWTCSKNTSDHLQYKRLRNKVTQFVNKAKSNYMSSTFVSTSSSKELWKKLKKLNVISSDHSAKFNNSSDEINTYFGGNFTRDPMLSSIPPLNSQGFAFSPCTELEVFNAISSISSNAVGMDGLPLRFIKLILPSVITPITYLFNLFISTATFPRAWKIAKIIPIRKNPAGSSLNNLRPISILCSLSKAFEKILKAQVQAYIERNNFLSPYQSGFRSGHSTISALLKVHDDLHKFIDKKGIGFLLLIDFSKAFDKVSHVKLLHKLSYQFNFSRNAIYLIQSYLKLRTQVVEINGNLSNPICNLSGVPQGSVLGPLLFSLFINDLPLSLKFCQIHMFADDVQLYICSTDTHLNDLASLINFDLESISQWSLRNLLPINSSKTKVMFVARRQIRTPLPDIVINGEKIEYVDRVRNLGVIFQSNLEWDSQVNAQSNLWRAKTLETSGENVACFYKT